VSGVSDDPRPLHHQVWDLPGVDAGPEMQEEVVEGDNDVDE
jgi:hypothetical protein